MASVYNVESSGSHLIVTSFNLESNETRRGKILLCDLCGSESLKDRGHQRVENKSNGNNKSLHLVRSSRQLSKKNNSLSGTKN